jgi:hypothetical protein
VFEVEGAGVEARRCGFCGISAAGAWALLAATDNSICDACAEAMGLIVELHVESGGGRAPASPGLFDRCTFCGSTHGPMCVGSEFFDDGPDPVICHDCVGIALGVVKQQGIDLEDPWYPAFRKEGFGWIRNPGAIPPEDSEGLLAELRGRRSEMVAEWQGDTAAGLAFVGGDALASTALENSWRRIIGIYLAEFAQAKGQPLAYETAREVGEVLMGEGPV